MGLKRTPLFAAHQKLGAKLIDFGGWEMPVQYTSIVEEHLAVRNAAGIFDISHMGEVTASGAGAAEFLNRVLTNDIRKLAPGLGQYTLLCHERGGVIDDLYAYRLSGEVFLLIINASRIEADVSWLQSQAAKFSGELKLTDASHNYAAVAVQGPRVKEFINECVPGASNCAMRLARATDLKKNQIGGFPFNHGDVLVSRTGYTGEDGFEVVGPDEAILHVWDKMLAVGQPFGIKPCGLGARDTLRTEVCYPLYGHELDEQTTPIEAGLGFFVALDKGEFNGRHVMAEQKARGVAKKSIAFKMTGKCAPPRPHYPIWVVARASRPSDGNEQHTGETPVPLIHVGVVTSGTQSPSLGVGIGMGYVPPGLAKPDTEIEIEIRGKRFPAVIVPKPIYRKT
ncbi:MAG TPA: glycine cleavage system aminomethyltransferase GcvT [Verrucomicrobiae bacterium]|nr:glycine cleavage system aminomethyltransferase GcvT [Verrucomicrobiae bacterium]